MGTNPQQLFEELTRGLPKFQDGRVNFTGARKAPVLNVVIYCDGQILLVKRSDKVSAYQGLWNGVSGFMDELKPIEDFAQQELSEELGIVGGDIKRIEVCPAYEVNDTFIDRIWYVYPVLAELKRKPDITLDWEHTDYAWINPDKLQAYKFVKDFDKSVRAALSFAA